MSRLNKLLTIVVKHLAFIIFVLCIFYAYGKQEKQAKRKDTKTK